MEEEYILSGYCRMLDQSRMVTLEIYDGQTESDCSFGSCPYESSCTIIRPAYKCVQPLLPYIPLEDRR